MKYFIISGSLYKDYQEWIWSTTEEYTEDELSSIAANWVYDKMIYPKLSHCGHINLNEVISDYVEITEQEYEAMRTEGVDIMNVE